jgi:hypothetical protein
VLCEDNRVAHHFTALIHFHALLSGWIDDEAPGQIRNGHVRNASGIGFR